MANGKLINCGNDFYEGYFNKLCTELESGETVEVYIDCIGHTRNNMSQEAYKRKLVEKYGDQLEVAVDNGAYCYSYYYSLKQ